MKNVALIRLALMIFYCHCSFGAIGQSISGIINSYYQVTAINTSTNAVVVSNAAGLAPGVKVLIIQMKGAVINSANLSSFGDITAIDEAGSYEFNQICGVAGNDVLLKYQLSHTYNSLGNVQIIPVPQYNIITVADTLKAGPWNAATGTGGVLVMEADTVYLNSAINVSGQGFAGGAFVNFTTPTYDCSWTVNVTNYFLPLVTGSNQYYSGGSKGEGIAAFILNAEYGRGKQANGGGGGNNHNTGGGGGANYGAGGNGGQRSNESFFLCHGTNPGVGGLAISSYGYSLSNNRIFMGGGGGSSHQNNGKGTPGGNGGGIVLLTADVLIGTGSGIFAEGLSPVNLTNSDPYTAEGDGGGGAGAGGSIILNVNQVIGSIDAKASGGRGSDASRGVSDCTGPGGGGGGGVVWMKGPIFSPNVSAVVTGGSNGAISVFSTAPCVGQANGATPGANGATLTDYMPPARGNFLCAPLSSPELKSFTARADQKNISLSWTMVSIDNISAYEVERSVNQVNYSAIAYVNNDGKYIFAMSNNDPFIGTIFYRLKIIRKNGMISYSQIIHVTRKGNHGFYQLNVFPNPVRHELKVSTVVKRNVVAQLTLFNASGQSIYHDQVTLLSGNSTFVVPVSQLSPGVYLLILEAPGIKERRKFIRKN
jgi:hypothetical protein